MTQALSALRPLEKVEAIKRRLKGQARGLGFLAALDAVDHHKEVAQSIGFNQVMIGNMRKELREGKKDRPSER